MDDNAPKENPPADFNKLDLSQLQGFSFGTQWTQEKPATGDRRDHEGGDRPRREGGGGAPDRRDRRPFRRPAGPGEGGPPAPAGGAAPASGAGPGGERREFQGRPRPGGPGGGGDFRGGPRREGGYAGGGGPGPGGQRYGQPQGGYAGRGAPQERGPYDSPYYSVTFYPEDTSFNTLVQTIRKSCRTVELFEIARTVVAKNDRFVVVLTHKPSGGFDSRSAQGANQSGAEGGTPAPKPARPAFYVSVPDGIPFESDEAAVAHVLSRHLDKFFEMAEVEVDPPKGNFQVINRCSITGELLGPPNYHRYNQILQQHYAAAIASRMSLEAFRSRIETVRDPEVVNQWLAKMKKITRYTWKLNGPKVAAPQPSATSEAVAPAAEPSETPSDAPVAENEAAPVAESAPAVPTTPNFDSLEDARLYLLTQARDKVVRTFDTARFPGKIVDSLPPGEIRRAIEGALDRQRRFPLDTANALRGRLRREHFTIFKKGSKGVSYVCAVKRKFRVPGQTFADSIGALISFIEKNPMVRASELSTKFLGISPVAAPVAAPAASEAATETAPAAEAVKTESGLSLEERAKISRIQGDLLWLVREGYVTEFIDGRLFAPPPMVEARKKEIENEEHDPENFPEVPPSTDAPVARAPESSSAPAEVVSKPATETPASVDAPVDTPSETSAEAANASPDVTEAAAPVPHEIAPVAETAPASEAATNAPDTTEAVEEKKPDATAP